MKIDKAIKQESIYLLIGVVILSAIMEAVFLICGAFDYTVILGNILGGGIAVLNFFLMGITLQKSLTDTEIKTAENRMKMSQSFRFLMLIIVAVIGGALLECFWRNGVVRHRPASAGVSYCGRACCGRDSGRF